MKYAIPLLAILLASCGRELSWKEIEGTWTSIPESQTTNSLTSNPTLYENESVLKGLSSIEIQLNKEVATFFFPESGTTEEFPYRVEGVRVLYVKAPGVPESRVELIEENKLSVEVFIDRPPAPPHTLTFYRK